MNNLRLIQFKLIGKISKKLRFFLFKILNNYLNPTAACQTNANARNNTGIAGITSTIGRNAV
jgi:hypothetical protein